MDVRPADAARLYNASRLATEPTAQEPSLATAAKSFVENLNDAEQTAHAAMAGRADPQALVQALAQTELAVETAVTLRNKVVAAYQEILRMPV